VRGHIDTDTLAAYREGLLSRRRAARVAAHLAGCPRCAETDAQLAGVTTMLAASQVPPMPAGLADRIEAALSAEAVSRAAAQAGRRPLGERAAGAARDDVPGDRRPATVPGGNHRQRPHRRSWLTPRVATVAAAVAVIVGGGYGVAQVFSNGSTTGGGSSTAARPEHGVGSSGAGTGVSGSRMAPSASSLRQLPVVKSRTSYQPQRLQEQAKAVLARYGRAAPRPAGTGHGALPGSPGISATNLAACVRRISRGHTPQLVDLATYQGRTAAVIMLPASQGQVRVVVVGSGCSAAASDVLAQTLIPGTG
jgi:hypothetical protein